MEKEQKKIVSVIEDDPVFCKVLEQHIEAYGYLPAIYNSVEDFITNKNQHSIAIILDHYLGKEETGYGSLGKIRNKASNTPIIYLTQLSKEELPTDFEKSKIHAYIGKDSASLVRLRTILEDINKRKRNFLQRLFGIK